MRQMPERACKDHVALAAIPGAFEPYAIRKNLRPGSAAEQAHTFSDAPPHMHDETLFGEYAQGFAAFALHRAVEHGFQSATHALAGDATLLRSCLTPPRQTTRITLLDHGKQRFPIAAQKGIL